MPLFYLSLSWLAGIFTGSFIALPVWLLAIPFAAIAPVLLLRRYRKTIILAGFCLLIFIAGALRYQSTLRPLDHTQLQFYNDDRIVQFEGMITDAPEIKRSSTVFRFSASSIMIGDVKSGVSGDALVRLPFYRELHYGDVLQLKGKLETPQQFEDFDYKNYLANQGIYSVMNYPSVVILDRDKGLAPLSCLYYVRGKLADSLSRSLPEPQSSLAQAIMLGLRGSIPDSLMQLFYITGTTHLLAISGLNLTIILGIILSTAIWLFGRKNKIYIWLSLVLIWLYTALTGMPATVVRAAIMGSVFLLAEMLGRQRNALAALSLAAALMAAVEPGVLRDVSFQLSFLSMLGLVFMLPYLNKFSGLAPPTHSNPFIASLRKIVLIGSGTALAAILATWPVIAMNFHSFSWVGMPATFFAMPSFPGIIIISIFTAVAGLIWQPLGYLVGWIAWLFLSYFLFILQIFSAIPFAYIQNIKLQPWMALIYYVTLIGVLLAVNNLNTVSGFLKSSWQKTAGAVIIMKRGSWKTYSIWLLTPLLAGNILIWLAFASLPDGRLHVSVLDVGQGEATLIRTPLGQNIVIDAGPDVNSACVQLGKELPFWDRKIDLLILTQPQSDHISGSIQLVKNYDVRNVVVSNVHCNAALYKDLKDEIKNKPVKMLTVFLGQQIDLGDGILMDVLNPPLTPHQGTDDDINNNSIVLRLHRDNISFLFTADICEETERYLIENRARLNSDVLKIAHHGSRGSTTDSFLAVADPSIAVISAGANNRFGHPHQEVIDRLREHMGSDRIFLTSTCGTIEFITDGQRLWLKTERALD